MLSCAETSVSLLTSGPPDTASDFGKTLGYLSQSSAETYSAITALLKASGSDLLQFGAFSGRQFLEISSTAVLARLDPFRILILRELQQNHDHDIEKPNQLSVRWQGDVIPDGKTSWGQDKKPESYSRAILGDCWDTLAWQPAFSGFLDAAADCSASGSWFSKLQQIDPPRFVPQARSGFSRLYSTLSKGIHLEFVVPPVEKFDSETLRVALLDVLFYSIVLSCVSHFADFGSHRLNGSDAIERLVEIQTDLATNGLL